MKIVLFIFGVLFGIGGLFGSPQGFVGLAFMVCGAIFFASGGIITAVEVVGQKIDAQGKMVRNGLQFVEGRDSAPGAHVQTRSDAVEGQSAITR
jgi:hypothetical protein